MTNIIMAIDGTGEWSNESYKKTMARSFVRRIFEAGTGPNEKEKFYHRGPSLTGIESSFYGASMLFQYLSALRAASATEPINIYITGYSRGAMIAVYVANRIDQFNRTHGLYSTAKNALKRSFGYSGADALPISIASLILFDAVDSDVTMAGPGISTVPPSVVTGTHYVCDPRSGSRSYFNRIVLKDTERKIAIKPYVCTHSCIGGLPAEGDNDIGASARGALSAGVVGALSTRPQPFAPAFSAAEAAARFVKGAAPVAWDAMTTSNVTQAADRKIFPHIEKELKRDLAAQGWPIKMI